MTIAFEITWTDQPDGSGTSLAWGEAVLSVNGAPIWCSAVSPKVTPVAWSWIELLEFLNSKWVYLLTEQTYPLGLNPKTPSSLRPEAEAVWEGQELFREDLDNDEELFRFEGRHDLARALRGIDLPSVLIMREGERAWVCTSEGDHYFPFDSVVKALEEIGSVIASHLKASSSDRARSAVRGWERRALAQPAALIRISTGISIEGLKNSERYQTLQFWELDAENGADSELAAAARLLPGSGLVVGEIDAVFEEIRKLPRVATDALDALALELRAVMGEMERDDPYRQGYAVALEVRKRLALGDGRIDPEDMVRSFGVLLIRLSLSEVIDAVGCWGPRHGPAIVLNTWGRRSKTVHGSRASLAHELCHLLLDRTTALPMAEVLGGRSPYRPERRSNAFAAELLFPRWQARLLYKKAKGLENALISASETFEVSRSLAAGQFLNASQMGLTSTEEAKLRTIVKSDAAGLDYWQA